MMSLVRLSAAALSLALVAASPVVAETTAGDTKPASEAASAAKAEDGDTIGGRKALAACRGDMQALCKDVAAGGGRKIRCLKDNQDKLSADCKAAIAAVVAKHAAGGGEGMKGHGGRAAGIAECRADVTTLCAGVQKGNGAIGKCLKENAAKVSQPCRAALDARKALQKQARAACKSDLSTLCGSVEKGHARMQCLRDKQAQASQGCQQALAQLPARHHKQ